MLEGPRSHARFGGLHELNGQPIEQCLVGSRGRLRPEVFNGLHQTHSEVLLPRTIDRHPRGGGRARIHQPTGECQAGIIRTRSQRRQERRSPMSHFAIGFQPVPPPEQASGHAAFARPLPLSRSEHQCRSALWPLLPQRLDPGIHLSNVCLGGAPIREHRRILGRSPSIHRDLHHDLTHRRGQRIGHGVRGRADRETEPPEIVGLQVVGVPTTVFLVELELQDRPLRKGHRLFGHKDRLAGLVPPTGAGINAPGRLRLAINGVSHRPIGSLLAGRVVELGLQRFLRVREIGGRLNEFYRDLVGRVFPIRGSHLELAECRHAANGPAGSLTRQVGIGQLLETKRGDGGE